MRPLGGILRQLMTIPIMQPIDLVVRQYSESIRQQAL